ncbi:hypothetical protein ACLRDC_09450 [Gluconacetobacter sacchari]|uniref:hypothetical protein n=1 Tax=Gluconacetobacter sacchari TaxID=92759 RepID=UPI0039B684AF
MVSMTVSRNNLFLYVFLYIFCLNRYAFCEEISNKKYNIGDDIVKYVIENKNKYGVSMLSLSDTYGITKSIYFGMPEIVEDIEKHKNPLYENALAKVSEYRIRGDYNDSDVNLRNGIKYLTSTTVIDIQNLSYLCVMYAGNLFMEGKIKDWIYMRNYIRENIQKKLKKKQTLL